MPDSFLLMAAVNYPEQSAHFAASIWNYHFMSKENMYQYPLTQIFPLSLDAFQSQGIDRKFHDKCLQDIDFLINNNALIQLIVAKIPSYFLQKGSATIRLFELCELTQKNRNEKPTADHQINYLIYALVSAISKENKLYSDVLFESRELITNYHHYLRAGFQLTLPHGNDTSLILAMICGYFNLISSNHSKDPSDALMADLLEMIEASAPSPPKPILFQTIKECCVRRNRLDLLAQNKSALEVYRNQAELKDLIQNLFDLMEGRSLADVDTSLKKNIQAVSEMKVEMNKTSQQTNVLRKQVEQQEVDMTNMSAGIKNINVKLDEFGEVIEEQDARIEEVNNKAVSNVPKWGKEISNFLG